MALKFRLRGLAETFIEHLRCPKCGHDGGPEGDQGFLTEYTRVTYDGIVVVIECEACGEIFVPTNQKFGIINYQKLRNAVDKDGIKTGLPILASVSDVKHDVEKLNAERNDEVM